MLTPDRANRFLDHGKSPFLTTEDVAEIAQIKQVTLRQWINRGHLELRFSPRVKTGRAMLFSFEALVEIMAFASLSRLGFPPNKFSGDLASVMTSGAFTYLMDITGLRGNYSELGEIERNFHRYVVTFYDIFKKELSWDYTSTPNPDFETFDGAWITLDCHLLMERTVEGFERLKQQQNKELL